MPCVIACKVTRSATTSPLCHAALISISLSSQPDKVKDGEFRCELRPSQLLLGRMTPTDLLDPLAVRVRRFRASALSTAGGWPSPVPSSRCGQRHPYRNCREDQSSISPTRRPCWRCWTKSGACSALCRDAGRYQSAHLCDLPGRARASAGPRVASGATVASSRRRGAVLAGGVCVPSTRHQLEGLRPACEGCAAKMFRTSRSPRWRSSMVWWSPHMIADFGDSPACG